MKIRILILSSLCFLGVNLLAQVGRITSQQSITDRLNLAAISDPGSPAAGDLWRSSTTADTLKYRSGGTTYTLLTTAGAGAGYQPLDSDLTSWAAITRASGFDTFTATPSGANLASLLTTALPASKGGTGLTALSANIVSLLGSADYSAARTNLGLTIGTNVQAWDTDLTTWAGVTPGTGVAAALAVNIGSAGAPVLFNGAGGTPSSITLTNATGTAASLTAGTATNATNATNTAITDDTTTNATMYPTWVTANTGNLPQKTTSTKLTFNPSTGALAATSFAGNTAASTITGTTLASNVVTSSLTTVGALTSGSIASGFGSINAGANSITGGAISGTTGTFSGILTASNGTAAAPSIVFASATTTGFYRNGSNIGISAGGIDCGTITAVGVGGGLFFGANGTNQALTFRASGTTGVINLQTNSTTQFQVAPALITCAVSTGFTFTGASGNYITNSDDTSGANFMQFRKANSTAIGSVSRVTTTDAVAYNTTSDGRLKTNVRDFTAADAGKIIDGLSPRWFDWKQSDTDTFQTGVTPDTVDANGKVLAKGEPILTKRKDLPAATKAKLVDDATSIIGFIAQEENAVDPALARIGAVTVGDSDPTTITKQWQRNDAALVPILVAALKDDRQRIAALEARVTAIEGAAAKKVAFNFGLGAAPLVAAFDKAKADLIKQISGGGTSIDPAKEPKQYASFVAELQPVVDAPVKIDLQRLKPEDLKLDVNPIPSAALVALEPIISQ